ncbi:hypothetical protein Tco_0162520 [Tanacetum coccineum]
MQLEVATYSASVVEFATTVCFLHAMILIYIKGIDNLCCDFYPACSAIITISGMSSRVVRVGGVYGGGLSCVGWVWDIAGWCDYVVGNGLEWWMVAWGNGNVDMVIVVNDLGMWGWWICVCKCGMNGGMVMGVEGWTGLIMYDGLNVIDCCWNDVDGEWVDGGGGGVGGWGGCGGGIGVYFMWWWMDGMEYGNRGVWCMGNSMGVLGVNRMGLGGGEWMCAMLGEWGMGGWLGLWGKCGWEGWCDWGIWDGGGCVWVMWMRWGLVCLDNGAVGIGLLMVLGGVGLCGYGCMMGDDDGVGKMSNVKCDSVMVIMGWVGAVLMVEWIGLGWDLYYGNGGVIGRLLGICGGGDVVEWYVGMRGMGLGQKFDGGVVDCGGGVVEVKYGCGMGWCTVMGGCGCGCGCDGGRVCGGGHGYGGIMDGGSCWNGGVCDGNVMEGYDLLMGGEAEVAMWVDMGGGYGVICMGGVDGGMGIVWMGGWSDGRWIYGMVDGCVGIGIGGYVLDWMWYGVWIGEWVDGDVRIWGGVSYGMNNVIEGGSGVVEWGVLCGMGDVGGWGLMWRVGVVVCGGLWWGCE